MASYLLDGKNILLGITGSIAAYKSADLVRRLRDAGATVRVCMTKHAKQFITPLTMQAVSGLPVHDDLFDLKAEAAMGHIELARWADIILIAPASADIMARLATGRADDLLTTLCLASQAQLIIAPAMNQAMWGHVATQANVTKLKERDVLFLGPATGEQACGDMGWGRMLEPAVIVKTMLQQRDPGLLDGKQVLITAGPTYEAIDPVRYITNGSTGKMGYALARAARAEGATVTLISGPTALVKPEGVTFIPVVSAQEMHDAVMQCVSRMDILIAVAAVSDYRPAKTFEHKLKKTEAEISWQFVRNSDIVADVGKLQPKPFIVGFAAETEQVVAHAQQKLASKNMDMIVANSVQIGMGTDENQVTVVTSDTIMPLPKMNKTKLASQLVEILAKNLMLARAC